VKRTVSNIREKIRQRNLPKYLQEPFAQAATHSPERVPVVTRKTADSVICPVSLAHKGSTEI
jgi:hypothetical protein